ncbi:MAG: SPFH domain-containing protein [Bryobacterales bacterium]|nr:SPFH domain-containing protein [Bryobacterales bacterium]
MGIGDFLKGSAVGDFVKKQFIDVIDWVEPGDGVLAWRYPMQDMEIQNGAKLTVRESQMGAFVNEGRMADVFGPGLYTLNTQTLPILTNLMNWDKMFQSPFKSDVYFFSTRTQINQRWGTANPLTIRDREFGAIRVRGNGVYSWHISDPRTFHTKISGTREKYTVADIEGQLRDMTLGHMADAIAQSQIPFLDLIANQVELANQIRAALTPLYAEYGLTLDSFVVREFSLPEELQKRLDERISMNMLGDMGRYTQYQVAQSIPIAAANEGGIAGIGAGLSAGYGMAQAMGQALNTAYQPQQPPPQPPPPMGAVPVAPVAPAAPQAPQAPQAAAPAADLKFCFNCGNKIPRASKFCAECGTPQPAA